MKTVKYGLRNKETGVLVRVERAGEYDCVDEYTLGCPNTQLASDHIWLLDNRESIIGVLNHGDVDWHNASYDTPQHILIAGDYEVVEITTTVEVEIVK